MGAPSYCQHGKRLFEDCTPCLIDTLNKVTAERDSFKAQLEALQKKYPAGYPVIRKRDGSLCYLIAGCDELPAEYQDIELEWKALQKAEGAARIEALGNLRSAEDD